MRPLRNRWALLFIGVLVVGGPIAWYARRPAADAGATLVTRVKQGDFRVVVTTTGELRARKFVQIQGPANAQQAEVWQMKISTMVPEGTVVKEGDVVAELDRAPVATKAAEFALAVQKAEAQHTQAQLDSTLSLAQAREDIRNLEFALEEKRLAREQAAYEAPTVRRQAEIDHERAQRQLEQSRVNYQTKRQQAVAKMSEVGADLARQRNKLSVVQGVMQEFTIRAPAPGMVIYVREWNGRKKGVGSQVSAWEPTVATLPDLMQMESVTYVNEIDVRRLGVGLPVAISLDAESSKRLTGKVVSVANVGEQRPNADAKVFEVKIALAGSDTTLRPGMTTSNGVETAVIPNALFIPLEAVTNEGAQAFVYKRRGGGVVRQQIETGMMNDNEVVVLRGLAKDDEVLLAPPANRASVSTLLLPGAVPTGDTARAQPVPAVR
ncbi:MAG TPA: HlyD family efflux transporter periplasmic adaptor subunit [Gemmatimonadaceae bacterium]|jgi:multidrug efflux pump subunit AcrA (membrane-fusion protein)|nr:HlyD family efflux transporter periplasmic adaptor subunit [Gemmatimonadaceae bacterium]